VASGWFPALAILVYARTYHLRSEKDSWELPPGCFSAQGEQASAF